MSFKAGIKTSSDRTYVFNSLRFETSEEAESWAKDLMRRWLLVTKYRVFKSDDPVNYKMIDGKLTMLEV